MRLHLLKMSVFFSLPLKNQLISLLLIMLFSSMGMEVSAATYYSRATGNWIGGTVWSTTPTGTASIVTILSTDAVVIQAAKHNYRKRGCHMRKPDIQYYSIRRWGHYFRNQLTYCHWRDYNECKDRSHHNHFSNRNRQLECRKYHHFRCEYRNLYKYNNNW